MKYLLLILLLSGCGVDDGDDFSGEYEGWTGEWVEKNDNFTVNYDESIEGPLLETIEQVWLEVQACVGLPTPAGIVIEYSNDLPNNMYGYYIGGYIRIEEKDVLHNHTTLRHEFIHAIQVYWALPRPDHDSPFFTDCV